MNEVPGYTRIEQALADCDIDLSKQLPMERIEVLALITGLKPKYVQWVVQHLRSVRGIKVR